MRKWNVEMLSAENNNNGRQNKLHHWTYTKEYALATNGAKTLYFLPDVLGLNSHSSTKTSWHETGFVTKIGVILITLATTATHGLTVFHIPILNGPQSFFSTQETQRDTCNLYSSSSLQKKPKQQSRHISFELPNHLAKAFWGWGGPNVYEV